MSMFEGVVNEYGHLGAFDEGEEKFRAAVDELIKQESLCAGNDEFVYGQRGVNFDSFVFFVSNQNSF